MILKQGMSRPGRPVYLRCEDVNAGLKCLRLVASDQLQVSCTGEEMKAPSGVDTGESATQWKFPAAHPDCDRVLPKPYGWFSIKTLFTKSCRLLNFLSGMDKIFFGVQCFHFSLKTKLVNSSNVK